MRQGSTATERQPARRLRPTLQRGLDLRLGRGTHAGYLAQSPCGDRVLERRDAVDVERTGDSQHALGGEPQRPPVADQVRLQLRFERLQLGDVARFHELAELGLDARTDAPQLPDPARAYELGDGRRCRADQLGRSRVRAHRERIRLRELEQGGEEREPVGDLDVAQIGRSHAALCSLGGALRSLVCAVPMIAVLGGLGAAVAWATTLICATRATRLIGGPSVLAWVMLIGLVVTLPWALYEGAPDVDGTALQWLILAGVGNCAGLLLVYAGVRIGKVGVVAPITSTEGAVAALLAVAAGEQLAAGTGIALAVVAVGIVLAGVSRDSSTSDSSSTDVRAALFGAAAALSFGASLFATGRVVADLPVAWAILPPRIVGVVAIALPLALAARLTLTRQALPFLLVAGVAEVAGFVFFALGARHGIAVSAVLASQFGVIAAIMAAVLFHERLTRLQIGGLVTIAVGVAVVSALQA